ncbi:MAG: hypothetical protein AB7F96_05445 [Beijerinckiaceae bacterium]
MAFSLTGAIGFLRDSVLPRLSIRFDKSPIDTLDKLGFFVHTRSAYVAQTSLYGYVKTRMGTQYRELFQDDEYVKAIDFAKWRVFAACLSDLCVFVTALVATECKLSSEDAKQFAGECFAHCVAATFGDCGEPALAAEVEKQFRERAATIHWPNAAEGESAFTFSPPELIHWAPIDPQLKQFDEKIVRNSIRFRWRDVRTQMRNRLDAAAIVADWRQQGEAEQSVKV